MTAMRCTLPPQRARWSWRSSPAPTLRRWASGSSPVLRRTTSDSQPAAFSKRFRHRLESIATPEAASLPDAGRPLRIALDTRALAGAEATGVGRYIQALIDAFADSSAVQLQPFGADGVPLLGPQLLTPLRMRLDGADLVHGPANALPLLAFGLHGVLTIHDLAIYDHPEWFPAGQWLATRVLVPESIRRARAIVCPSEATRQAIGRLFAVGPERVHVIPHGVETEFSLPASASVRAEVRQRYGLPARYLLQVGTVQPRKNYVTTLRALARIPAARRIPLVAVGNFGWNYEPVVDAVRELDLSSWVRFVGYAGLRDLPALYQMADASVFPSLDEGFGLPVLEAFAAGTPLIASIAGSIPEVAGEAALLCDPQDDQALASHLEQLLSDAHLRRHQVAAGRARAALFSWSASAAAHHAVYESVVRS